MDFQSFSKINRFKDIVFTLMRYGFGDIISRLDLPEKILPVPIKKQWATDKNTWERIRLVLTDLGPTFVKFGQILSLRADLIPHELVLELSKLQDQVQPESFEAIKTQIEKSMEKPLEEVFADFEPQPLAAASLAQVHRAVLKKDKTVVAVKVQRPGIRQTIRNDLDILATLARQVHERLETLKVYDLPLLVEELRRLLTRELDFTLEGKNIRLARSNFAGDPEVVYPAVFTDESTSRVLIMELVRGTKLRQAVDLPLAQKKRLAQIGLRALMQQVLMDGFFHADPHPGNIYVLDDGRISFLDWGMVGRVTPDMQARIIALIEGIVDRDSEAIMELILSLSENTQVKNREELQRDILDVLDEFYAVPLSEINISQLLMLITEAIQRHQIRIKADMAVMIKAMITGEGTVRMLYPELNVVAEAEPFVRKMALKKYSPRELQKQTRKLLGQFFQMQKALPLQLNHVMGKLERDELSIGFEHKRLEGLRMTLDQIANRLTLGIVTAAMIIGSSMIVTTGVKPLLFGYPALGLVGYLQSAFFGAWLAFEIIRKRKM